MPRFVIQSTTTGRFLAPDPEGGEPMWFELLRQAGGGVCDDMERVVQLVADCCDPEDMPQVIDLDRLGTDRDY